MRRGEMLECLADSFCDRAVAPEIPGEFDGGFVRATTVLTAILGKALLILVAGESSPSCPPVLLGVASAISAERCSGSCCACTSRPSTWASPHHRGNAAELLTSFACICFHYDGRTAAQYEGSLESGTLATLAASAASAVGVASAMRVFAGGGHGAAHGHAVRTPVQSEEGRRSRARA